MQIRNKKNLIGAFLALVIALSVSAALGYSQGRPDRGGDHGGRGMHGGFGPFGRNLNLSDAQKTQMQQIAARYEASTKSLRDQLRSLHKNQADSFGGGAFDENFLFTQKVLALDVLLHAHEHKEASLRSAIFSDQTKRLDNL
jgi:Spy/CpxP family protein refolding chaperone